MSKVDWVSCEVSAHSLLPRSSQSAGTGAPECARPLQRRFAAQCLLEALLGLLEPLRFAVLTSSLSWLQLGAFAGDKRCGPILLF